MGITLGVVVIVTDSRRTNETCSKSSCKQFLYFFVARHNSNTSHESFITFFVTNNFIFVALFCHCVLLCQTVKQFYEWPPPQQWPESVKAAANIQERSILFVQNEISRLEHVGRFSRENIFAIRLYDVQVKSHTFRWPENMLSRMLWWRNFRSIKSHATFAIVNFANQIKSSRVVFRPNKNHFIFERDATRTR